MLSNPIVATVDFDVVGTILTVSVTNQTAAPASFNISEIYFNSSDDVTDLTFTDGPGPCPNGGSCRWDFFSSSGMGGLTNAEEIFARFEAVTPSTRGDHLHVGIAQAFEKRVVDALDVTGGHGRPPLCEWRRPRG